MYCQREMSITSNMCYRNPHTVALHDGTGEGGNSLMVNDPMTPCGSSQRPETATVTFKRLM